MNDGTLSRRQFVAGSAAGLILPSTTLLGSAKPKKAVRFAHITDIHVQPERGAPQGLAQCLHHAQSQKSAPDFILSGGDLIMDALGADKARTEKQWQIFTDVLIAECSLKVEHTIGNHDVWGWNRRSEFEKEPKFGKAWALEVLELERSYRSFDRGGWHFVILDSVFPKEGQGYTAKLDEKQFAWLEADLKATPKETPIIIVSHIPILAVCAFMDGDCEKSGDWVVPGAWMHIDARRLKDLFKKFPNVKLCISGHEHLIDTVVYNGVTYCCNGACSAGWWGGDYQECTYGYTMVDLFTDGTFKLEYIPYGWKTQ